MQLQAAFQDALSALAPTAAGIPSGCAIKPSGAKCTASELCSLLQASDVETNAASACPSAALECSIAAALQLHLGRRTVCLTPWRRLVPRRAVLRFGRLTMLQ